MSRHIDPENLSYEDLLYIAQRPTLRAEFALQGLPDPLEDFDFSVLNPNTPETYGIAPYSEDDGEEANESDWNKSMKKGDLLDAVAARNEDREEGDLIDVDEDNTKDEIIAALKADDESSD